MKSKERFIVEDTQISPICIQHFLLILTNFSEGFCASYLHSIKQEHVINNPGIDLYKI